MGKVAFEFSAGGLVIDRNKILMIRVENLQKEIVWTFPKGHIEKKETAQEAALREVVEETGYNCEILKNIDSVQYWFKDKEKLIKKTVKWFLMKPLEKIKEPDSEILEIRWQEFREAEKNLNYKNDKELLKKAINQNV
ncbi:MAG: NUDIX hydrolase [Elusimicrobia bacterium]|nr:NUDIX hydrolase [Elusimicrobiota bacterium]